MARSTEHQPMSLARWVRVVGIIVVLVGIVVFVAMFVLGDGDGLGDHLRPEHGHPPNATAAAVVSAPATAPQ